MSNSRNFAGLGSNTYSGSAISTNVSIGALANSAYSNTIYLQGVSNYQNTTISNVNSLAQAAYNAANNVAPQIQPAFNVANTASSNTIYLQGALNQTNSDIVTANTRLKSYVDTQASYQSSVDAAQNNNITNVNTFAQGAYNTANVKFNTSGGNITGPVTISSNLTITGNLTVAGNVTTVSANNLILKDNMIYLNDGSVVANPDLGIAGNYNDGTYRHAGFFRDASDGYWKVYDQYLPEPDASPYIDTSNSSFRIADFQANNVTLGKITTSSSQLVTNLNSQYLNGQTGSYYTTAGNLSGTIPSGVLGNSSLYVGTTAIALNRASGSQSLTGVSIDGNAATATSADNIDGIAFKNSNSTSSFVVDTQATNGIGYSSGYTLFGQSDGGVYCSTHSADWQHQINGDFRTGQIAIRGKNSGTWQSWRTVLDSSNYSSYALPLGGGTVTGTANFNSSQNHSYVGQAGTLVAYASPGTTGATMSFHRPGYYAINLGLDSDNVFRIGGWSASSNRLQMDMSGNLTMAGNVTAYSDIRLKENIKVIENALGKVLQIRGVTFTRNDQEDKEKIYSGVIAQEVERVLPEVISEDNEGIKNVAYGNMIGLLIEAIKEQQKQIDELKTHIGN